MDGYPAYGKEYGKKEYNYAREHHQSYQPKGKKTYYLWI